MGQIITVNFRGDELYGFEQDDGVFVALRPIVEAMGLNWSGQLQRLKRDPILSEGVCIMHTPFASGGGQEAVCLKLELVNGWLFTIDTARITAEHVREKVILYQRECYGVLAAHFLGKGHKPEALEGDPKSEESIAIRRALVTEARQTFDIHAARELWLKLGLPVVPAMLQPPAETLFTYSARKEEAA